MNGMNGPFHLVEKSIDNYVMTTIPGIFMLGEIANKAFQVKFVGRDDHCLNHRLKEQLGRFTYFEFLYSMTPKEAYLRECTLYHEYSKKRELENIAHPLSPGRSIFCPFCNPITAFINKKRLINLGA